ncbi:hypothetical protein RHMOL_Rhmol02G0268400 [Rhododendron molle]|uniref:Uncharacterized protein n=1 Tax=Rhododendron molle TaxID=49168 RepID=A0ACC0PW87_RHOML|nr:hypothetical protein RHMOL_Rhmol02G0268400 [Rhododendron molle]
MKEKIKLSPGALFAEVPEEHRPLLSDILFQWPSTFVPPATPQDFESVYDGPETLVRYRLEVDWLLERIDQIASLLELSVVRHRLEKVSKELEECRVLFCAG